MSKNKEIAKMLYEMSAIYEMFDVEFKPRMYEKAANTLVALDHPVEEIAANGEKALIKLPGIGERTAKKILEYLKTGKIKRHQALKKKMPADVLAMTAIEGVGPKMVRALYEGLGIKTLKDLEKAVNAHKVQELPGFGEKTEQMLAEGLAFVKKGRDRYLLGEAKPYLDEILEEIRKLKAANRAQAAGSMARWRPTIGDFDLVVETMDPEQLFDDICELKQVNKVLFRQTNELFVRLKNEMDMDVVATPPQEFGAAMLYFSGGKFHNIAIRALAQKQGMKLTNHGLYKGRKFIAGKTEAEIYEALGMQFIPPELRNSPDVVKLATAYKIPKLIEEKDIRGDLHVHTNWTEGNATPKAMALAAAKLGHEYIAITDHTQDLAMTNGMDDKRLLSQMRALDKLNKELGKKIRILKGVEANIREDGTIDIMDKTLAKLDIVHAAVHSQFSMSRDDMTRRMLRAVENPHVDVIAHPTGRILKRRDGIVFDIDKVFKAAAKTKTAMQVNGHVDRLDLGGELVRKAIDMGVKLTTDTDAHAINHLQFMPFAVHTARRGWAQKKHVLNTKVISSVIDYIKLA